MRVSIDMDYVLIGHARMDNITIHGPDVQSMYRYFFFVVCLICIPVITAANLLVIWSILLYPGYNYCHNYFLFSQAVFDLVMGVYCVPMYSLRYWHRTEELILGNKYACLAWFSSDVLTDSGLLHSLLLIAVDRYIAVMFPLKYHAVVTPRRSVLTLLLVWNWVIFTAFIPMLGWNRYAKNHAPLSLRCHIYTALPYSYVMWVSLISIGLVLVTSCILYSQIVVVVLTQSRELKELISRFSQREMKRLDHHLKSVKISTFLTFLYILFWLPSLSVGLFKPLRASSAEEHETAEIVIQCLQFINCALNFSAYICFQTDFTMVLKLMLTTRPWRWKGQLRMLYGRLHAHTSQYTAFTTSEFFSERPITELASDCKQTTAASAGGSRKYSRDMSSPVDRCARGAGKRKFSKRRVRRNSQLSPVASITDEDVSDRDCASASDGGMSEEEEEESVDDFDATKDGKSRRDVAMFLDQIYKVSELKPSSSSVISYITSEMISNKPSATTPGTLDSSDAASQTGALAKDERRRGLASDSLGTSVDDARLDSRRSSRAQRAKRLRSASQDP